MKFPLERDGRPFFNNRVFDFLAACVVDGDLELDETQLKSIRVEKYIFTESYEDEGETYDIFEVELSGDDQAIRNVEIWLDQFDKPLN